MIPLQLTLLDARTAPHALRRARTRIGRGPGNDIVLEDRGVHPTHAIVALGDCGLELHDVSGDGVLLNSRRVFSSTLTPGDVLGFGDLYLRLERCEDERPAAVTPSGDTSPTRLMRCASAPPPVQVNGGAALLRYPVRDGWRTVRLEEGATFLGSATGNHLTLGHPTVSRWHARIDRVAHGYTVVDLGSRNGTCVNGARLVEGPIPLGAELRLGELVLQLLPAEAAIEGGPAPTYAGIVGQTPVMRALFADIERYAAAREPALLLGETGTGKELVARALHTRSPRSAGSFVAVNCGALPRELVESELFGHERGAFSGANTPRRGLFEEAHGGTLFLDEVAETSLDTQAKLLRVLESGEVRRVGSNIPRTVDVRVVAACNQSLLRLIEQGRFRLDLYHRLCVVELRLPALRDRIADLPMLARHLLSVDGCGGGKLLSEPALAWLERQAWPGNIRELRNRLRRAALTADGAYIEPMHLGVGAGSALLGTLEGASEEDLSSLERRHIVAALHTTGGNKSAAAKRLGIARSTLNEKLRRYELQ